MIRAVSVLLAPVLLAPWASASGPTRRTPAARNVVQRIDVSAEAGAVVIGIALRAPPTFTTRAVGASRTFVIDFPETRFERFSPVIQVGKGAVAQVESSVALREGVQVARISVVLAREGEPPQVAVKGSVLRVRIAGGSEPLLVAKAPEPVVPPATATPVPEPPAPLAAPEAPVPDRGAISATAAEEVEATAAAEAPAAPEPPPAPVVIAAQPPPPAPVEPRRTLREVVFRPSARTSAVVVRLSGPPRFEVLDGDERRVAIVLSNTAIGRRNDSRPLDTSFFPGPVASVVSRRSGSGTRVEIALKRKASHRARVDGDTLVIEFDHLADP